MDGTACRKFMVGKGDDTIIGRDERRFISRCRKYLTTGFYDLVENTRLYFFHFKIGLCCLFFCKDNFIPVSGIFIFVVVTFMIFCDFI